MLEPGKVIGKRFQVERPLGSGAMGTVYKALFFDTGKSVAIKFINLGLAGSESHLARFEREGEILKQLRHPNIVRLIATGRYKGEPFLAMEYVEGESADQLLDRRGRLPWEEVVHYGKQLCDALVHAHGKGIIHRDLKPSNLMILPDGTLKLADFGIAKDTDVTALTGANSTVGTAAYMSPEQCKGERTLTHKSDLYSLGIVFYELLTGEKPFQKDSPVDMFMAHVTEDFERPSRRVLDIPPWLDTLVCQLMEKKPEMRPLDAAMVRKSLDEVLGKVADHRSAGLEYATARARDRTGPVNADETDREAARALRSTVAKRRIRKRVPRFYERTWFLVVTLPVVLTGIGWLIYWGFSAPKPETYFRRAETLVRAGKSDAARETLRQFIDHYPDLETEQARQMRLWYESIEVEQLDRAMFNRFHRMKPEGEAQPIVYAAMRHENMGELDAARAQWKELADTFSSRTDLDEQAYGWLGRKKLSDIDQMKDRERTLIEMSEKQPRPRDVDERAALALRFERFGDVPAAIDRWSKYREDFQKDYDARANLVMAAAHLRELKPKAVVGEKDIREFRRKLIHDQLAKVDDLAKEPVPANLRPAHALLRDIITLYADDPDEGVKPLVREARERQIRIPRPPPPSS